MQQTPFGNNQKGLSIVEILVAIVIVAIAFVSLLKFTSFSLTALNSTSLVSQAKFLAEEVIEQGKNFRDGTAWGNGLGPVILGTAYHFEKSSDIPTKWLLATGEETVSAFRRKIIFDNGRRDGNSNIVETGGNVDLNTKKAIITVVWQERGISHQMQLITYLTNRQ